MPNITITVENEGAERLLNYLIAYRKLVVKNQPEKKLAKKQVTKSIISPFEQIPISQ